LVLVSQVDIHEVPDFNTMYELYDPCTLMFFFRNKVHSGCPALLPGRPLLPALSTVAH
jgi:DIM1 family U5 snRNP protein